MRVMEELNAQKRCYISSVMSGAEAAGCTHMPQQRELLCLSCGEWIVLIKHSGCNWVFAGVQQHECLMWTTWGDSLNNQLWNRIGEWQHQLCMTLCCVITESGGDGAAPPPSLSMSLSHVVSQRWMGRSNTQRPADTGSDWHSRCLIIALIKIQLVELLRADFFFFFLQQPN